MTQRRELKPRPRGILVVPLALPNADVTQKMSDVSGQKTILKSAARTCNLRAPRLRPWPAKPRDTKPYHEECCKKCECKRHGSPLRPRKRTQTPPTAATQRNGPQWPRTWVPISTAQAALWHASIGTAMRMDRLPPATCSAPSACLASARLLPGPCYHQMWSLQLQRATGKENTAQGS